jgi:hypothetical protein
VPIPESASDMILLPDFTLMRAQMPAKIKSGRLAQVLAVSGVSVFKLVELLYGNISGAGVERGVSCRHYVEHNDQECRRYSYFICGFHGITLKRMRLIIKQLSERLGLLRLFFYRLVIKKHVS